MKNKDRRKIREKEEEDVGAAGFFLWDGEEGFLVFFCIFLVVFAECPAKAKL